MKSVQFGDYNIQLRDNTQLILSRGYREAFFQLVDRPGRWRGMHDPLRQIVIPSGTSAPLPFPPRFCGERTRSRGICCWLPGMKPSGHDATLAFISHMNSTYLPSKP
jgi:hypothetical protein